MWIENLQYNDRDNHFTAVKLGDVNGSAIANSIIAGTRSMDRLDLITEDIPLMAAQKTDIKLRADISELVYGMQLALSIPDLNIEDGKLKLQGSAGISRFPSV